MSRRRLYRQPLLIGAKTRGPSGNPLTTFRDPIRDAEAFCTTLLEEAFDEWGHFERPDEFDESLQELIIRALRLERTYDPTRSDSFADYARYILRRRAADVGPRRILGRSGNRTHDYLHDRLDESPAGHRPHEPVSPLAGDPHHDRGPDARRLQDQRDRERSRSLAVLGLRAA